MASAHRQLTSIACPGCGAQYEFPASMAGRTGRCVSCGTEFVVPAFTQRTPDDTPAIGSIFDDEERESPPQYIAVVCRVCQTRMYGRPDQVGQTLKCPDCGAAKSDFEMIQI